MKFRTLLAVFPVLLVSPAGAEDRLPDEAAVKAFVATDNFNIKGWWQAMDLPSRPTPGQFMFIDWEPGPPAVFRMKAFCGNIHAGKGGVIKADCSMGFSASGEMESVTAHLDFEGLTERMSVKSTDNGKWSVDSFGGGKTITLTAGSFAEAMSMAAKQSVGGGEVIAILTASVEHFNEPAAVPGKITAVKADEDGKKRDAWRLELPWSPAVIVSKMDGRVLQFESGKYTLRRSTELAVQTMLETMKKKDDAPLDAADIGTASLTFHGVERKLFSPSRRQRVKSRAGGVVEVLTGVESTGSAAERTEDLTPYTKSDPAITGHEKFKAILTGVPERAEVENMQPTEFAIQFARQIPRSLKPEFTDASMSVAECLEKGRGDIKALNRLVVEGCRFYDMACREVHGFVVEADSLPVVARRHVWVEVLEDGEWEAVDPWMIPGKVNEDDEWEQAHITGLHVEVCRGAPDEEQEKFLQSHPAVTVDMTNTETFPDLDPRWKWGRPRFADPAKE